MTDPQTRHHFWVNALSFIITSKMTVCDFQEKKVDVLVWKHHNSLPRNDPHTWHSCMSPLFSPDYKLSLLAVCSGLLHLGLLGAVGFRVHWPIVCLHSIGILCSVPGDNPTNLGLWAPHAFPGKPTGDMFTIWSCLVCSGLNIFV